MERVFLQYDPRNWSATLAADTPVIVVVLATPFFLDGKNSVFCSGVLVLSLTRQKRERTKNEKGAAESGESPTFEISHKAPVLAMAVVSSIRECQTLL
jgi:hypothetical protein